MPVRALVQSQDPEVASLVASLLGQHRYETHVSSCLEETATLARRHGPLDLVVNLDDRVGEVALKQRLSEVWSGTRVLMLPALRSMPGSGPEAQLATNGVSLAATELIEVVENALSAGSSGQPAPVVSVETLKPALIETILSFSLLLEQFAFVNGGNSRLVMEYAQRIARELGLSATHTEEVALAAILQDVGLVKLKAAEARGRGARADRGDHAARIKDHPLHSVNLIQRMKLPWRIRHIVLAHHEWYNGLGYPNGLEGRAIPLGARILSVVNAFFSMISRRPNRAPLSKTEALEELRARAGRQFDPEVVEVMKRLMRDKDYHDEEARPRRIAVLSSDPALGVVARAKLESLGREVSVLPCGEAAVAQLRESRPDACVLDAALADMSGFQLLHWIKQDPELSDTPVLVVSSAEEATTHAYMAHDMGADDFVLKPVRAGDLAIRLNVLMRKRLRVSRADVTQIHDGEGLAGSLDELSVSDLVHMLAEGRKTASVTLVCPYGRAELAFEEGTVVHARVGAEVGEDAFKRLYGWREGGFMIEHGTATAERTIRRRMDLLLSEASAERERLAARAAGLTDAPEGEVIDLDALAPLAAASAQTQALPAAEPGGSNAQPRERRAEPSAIELHTDDPADSPEELLVIDLDDSGTETETETETPDQDGMETIALDAPELQRKARALLRDPAADDTAGMTRPLALLASGD